ncbi:hypothetical protein GCM10011497_06840 [Elstera cyanobacteriorum]|uniref:Uncharacterized protein n=1 Tax=Elstera cyanobacteriorum TaxID=2022747 RepID=A0A255XT89_9PROT|nr:hypothetical protein [Elstera cyanobacteriorum]OYQ20206.1 hypothetical protein CHR90_05725 [Elstera cyanobacteriorum]GFZ80900.1 hypothetical protein GCM10011497_06840 [Elstera cyanobacteriorum]
MSQEYFTLPAALLGQITQMLAVTTTHHAMSSVELADNPAARQPHDQIARGCQTLMGQIRDALAAPAPAPQIGLNEGDLFAQGMGDRYRSTLPWEQSPDAVLREYKELTPIRILRTRYLPAIYGVSHIGIAHVFATEAEAAEFCARHSPPAEPATDTALPDAPVGAAAPAGA